MLTTVKGYYDHGKVTLTELPPPMIEQAEVFVTFLGEKSESGIQKEKNKITFGSLKGKISLPDDFDEPLEDLKDYM